MRRPIIRNICEVPAANAETLVSVNIVQPPCHFSSIQMPNGFFIYASTLAPNTRARKRFHLSRRNSRRRISPTSKTKKDGELAPVLVQARSTDV